jgi:serine protease Do
VQRGGTKQNLQDRSWETLGIKVEPIAREDFAALNSHYRGGLRVTSVRADGPAHDQGIRKGDVLVGMHVWQTVSLDNFAYILDRDDLTTMEPLLFYILREGDTLFGHIRLAKKGE